MVKSLLKDHLKKRGIKEADLARRLKLGRNTISRLVNNSTKSIKYDTIERICVYLNISVGDLFEITDNSVK